MPCRTNPSLSHLRPGDSPEVQQLRIALGTAKGRLREPWQSIESIRISEAEIERYSARLIAMGAA